jgi:hypothetical protein
MHTPLRTHLRPMVLVAVLGICAVATAGTINVSALGAPVDSNGFANGQSALDRLGDRLPIVAAEYGMNPGELRQLLLDDSALAVDAIDGLAYFDVLAPGEQAAVPAPEGPSAAPPVTGPEFQLSSQPGADKTIYLDFDGHTTTGTSWNSAYGITSIVSPAYSTDSNYESWSASELQTISDTWKVVAEDFAPWNVNVTTIDPGTEALRRSGSGDTQWGARVVITDDTFANCGCGGHAYVGAFDDTQDEPTFVYNSSFVGVSEATSHEVGHMLGLSHDGTSSVTYYQGHDTTGTPGWAPIMGAAYYEPVTQWSRQEFYGANNTNQDDLAIISSLSNGNNFGLRADDHGNTLAGATALIGDSPSTSGIIGTRTDVDVFSFTTSGGDVSFSADNAAVGPNLDIQLTLRNSTGGVIAQNNIADGLDAALAVTVAAGTYSLEIDGVGVGSPGSNPPSGYTDYGSIGQYTLTGTITGTTPPDTDPPAAPTGLSAVETDGNVQLTWGANSESDLAGYTVRRSSSPSEPFAEIGATNAATTTYIDADVAPGTHHYIVTASDTSGNISPNSNVASVDVPEPPVDLTTQATDETPVYGNVSGTYAATTSRLGAAQTITEVDSGGKPDKRHDRAEHRWSIPADQGNQTLTVVAMTSSGSDADTGFAVEWSDDGSTWIPFITVANGDSVDITQPIGAPTGTVTVRVIDTNRSRGETAHNSITVDFLQIEGDGNVVEPPQATMVVASLSTSLQAAGRGQQYGVVTVQVNDNLGAPISGASVTVTLSGDFGGSLNGTTVADGSVRMQTANSARKPSFSACIATLSTGTALPYSSGNEAC